MSQFQIWYRSQPVALRTLIAINVVVYVVACFVRIFGLEGLLVFAAQHLALNPELPGLLMQPWQVLTYNFLHMGSGLGGLLHVGFNMLWLYWIGKEYEEMHGPHQLLALYVIGGVGGGLLTVFLHALFPGFGPFGGPVYGASASVLGVIMAVAILYPYKKIRLLFIGTIRLLHLALAFLAIDILINLSPTSGVAVAAHMGGALSGFLFAKAERSGIDLTSWARLFFPDRRSTRSRRPPPAREEGGSFFGQLRSLFDADDAETSDASSPDHRGRRGQTLREDRARRKAQRNEAQEEIDRILDKISERGYDALSEEEKRILHRAGRQ